MEKLADGLWAVKFISNSQSMGAGVFVIANGAILGGDSQYSYIGSANVVNGIINADVAVSRHTRIPGGQSIFGPIEKFDLILTGKIDSKEMVLAGRMKENSSAAITIACSKLAGIPGANADV